MLGFRADSLELLNEKDFDVTDFEVISLKDVMPDVDEFNRLFDAYKTSEDEKSLGDLKTFISKIEVNYEPTFVASKYTVDCSSTIKDVLNEYKKFENVEKENLNNCIKECLFSMLRTNTLKYIKNNNISFDEVGISVVVQKEYDVCFDVTLNTFNKDGLLNECKIEVGEKEEDIKTNYYYNLSDKLYYYDGKIEYFSKDDLDNLVCLGEELKVIFGRYLKIDLSYIDGDYHINNVSKVTGIDDNNVLILDNKALSDRYPGITLPLTISFAKKLYGDLFYNALTEVLGTDNKDEIRNKTNNLIKTTNGKIYYNVNVIDEIMDYLPSVRKALDDGKDDIFGIRIDKTNKVSMLSKFKTYTNAYSKISNSPKSMDELYTRVDEIGKYFEENYNDNLSKVEIWNTFTYLMQKFVDCFYVSIYNEIYTNVYTEKLKRSLKSTYGNFEEKVNEYIAELTNTESIKPVRELVNLAYEKDELKDEIFASRFKYYINNYGDRNLEDLKLETKTFRTNPEYLISRIDDYRKNMDSLKDIYKIINSDDKNSLELLDGKESGTVKKCLTGFKNKEIARLGESRVFGMCRTMFLKLGQILKNEGILSNTRDIFYLDLNDVKDIVFENSNEVDNPQEAYKLKVSLKKEEYERFNRLPSYTHLVFEKGEFDKRNDTIKTKCYYFDDTELRGISSSNGVVKGEALVINSVRDIKETSGKILVAKSTDAGFGFLLPTAKGVISEFDTVLSNTSMISREIKMPSIVGVNNLLETIKTGDVVSMDGGTGIIKIEKLVL